jgi:hypothetical protein
MTGPKTRPGGENMGVWSMAYYTGISGIVKRDPIRPTSSAIQRTSNPAEQMDGMSRYIFLQHLGIIYRKFGLLFRI